MNIFLSKVRTTFALGFPNLVRVLSYRLSVKFGINPVRWVKASLPTDHIFFTPFTTNKSKSLSGDDVSLTYFGWYSVAQQFPPDWHQNPFNGITVSDSKSPWWQISDFSSELGDIKTVWEASRFDWVLHFSQQVALGNRQSLTNLNRWLADWCKHNPAYYGPNWKCGQEVSIRVMHLAYSAYILQQYRQPTDAILVLVKAHVQRIAPTIQYAIAQDNNHGTSEAAALFIGGSWLHLQGDKAAKKWEETGRKWLENRAARLIESDGSFSQYSVNYHRVMLDTYSMVEHWRIALELPAFSEKLYQRLMNAANWLYCMIQPETGDAPNLGANDGARLLPLSNTGYRDFRPSVQLATALFGKKNAYSGNGSWNELLRWLNLPVPERAVTTSNLYFFPDGGYCVLKNVRSFVLLRFPRFHFRPSQADSLHVDLWLNGQNFLRDGGTYSYNAGADVTRYFGGTASHNTIQFDNRDQMPRLSRFLFGEWLKTDQVVPPYEKDGCLHTLASYRDYLGAFHKRSVKLTQTYLEVHDTFAGFQNKAILRWRLSPDDWVIEGRSVSDGMHKLSIQTDLTIQRFEIVEGWESRYYMQKTPLPVLEVEVQHAGEITTMYEFLS